MTQCDHKTTEGGKSTVDRTMLLMSHQKTTMREATFRPQSMGDTASMLLVLGAVASMLNLGAAIVQQK